jgi:hypothetical protein
VPFWQAHTYTGWDDFREYSADVVLGMGLPGAMIADAFTDGNATQRIINEGGIGTALGGALTTVVTGGAVRGGFGAITQFARGALAGGGIEYGTQVYGNYQNGVSLPQAMTTGIDLRRITKWGLLGGTSGVAIAAQPVASFLYGGTSALGYSASTTFLGGFTWDGLRTATAAGLIGGGSAPVMTRLPGVHGALINTSQYTLGQWLNCQPLDTLSFGLSAAVGWIGGRIGGSYSPLRASPNPVRPLPTMRDPLSQAQARAAQQLIRESLIDNAQLMIGSTIRSGLGSTLTNLPIQQWWEERPSWMFND